MKQHGCYCAAMGATKPGGPLPDGGWETSSEQCPKCEGYHVEYRVFDIGPDARYRYRCNDCDHGWWAETDQ
jgi:hypothetical protein